MGDPRRENAIRNLCFSTKSGDPPMDCDIWNFEFGIEKINQRLLMMNGSSLMAQGSWLIPQGLCLKAHGSWPRNIWRQGLGPGGPRTNFFLAMRHEPRDLRHEP